MIEFHYSPRFLNGLFAAFFLFASTSSGKNDWCQDNAAGRRCALWKIRGLCKSSLPRVKAMMRGMCYETCNLCEPPSLEVCYNSKHQVSAYGCCWDGIIAATGPGGQGCPACEDRMSRKFCSMMKDICFTRENHKVLQANCPATCGYCMKAPHPCRDESGQEIACQNDCYDLDPKELCERRQWTGYCKVQRWQNYLKKRCAWTCGFCDNGDQAAIMARVLNKK